MQRKGKKVRVIEVRAEAIEVKNETITVRAEDIEVRTETTRGERSQSSLGQHR